MTDKQEKEDIMLKLCVNQGYVPPTCLLSGQLVFHITGGSGDPCKGCNHDREICKGRPK